jgi:hypothetical protein
MFFKFALERDLKVASKGRKERIKRPELKRKAGTNERPEVKRKEDRNASKAITNEGKS